METSRTPALVSRPAFADVALHVPLRAGDRVFTFAIPEPWQGQVTPGIAVRVPFGRQNAVGFVVTLADHAARRVRAIAAIESRIPPLPADLVSLATWMADYYVCSVGEAIAAMLPPLAAALSAKPAEPIRVRRGEGAPPAAPDTGVVAQLNAGKQVVAVVGEAARFEAYAQALQWALDRQTDVIVLVPEVAQAERLLEWILRRTVVPAVLLAGDIPPRSRWEIWRQIASGAVRVVVGTRSAVFAPMPRLGLLIVDHEEDSSYKEEREPRYHVRRVAQERSRLQQVPVIYGTPAPSLEVVAATQRGEISTITLLERTRPLVAISDVRAQAGPLGGLFGRRLFQALAQTLPRGRAIIFVPHRGYADFLLCHECGAVPRCPRCGVALTYHLESAGASGDRVRTPAAHADLRCHLCGHTEPVPTVCPSCGGTQLRPHGLGTERVEQVARKLFRATPVHRLDAESAPNEVAQIRVWQQFERRGGLLIGTQLLIKGVGQIRAPVVGAVGVDAVLHLPDFRAAERLHQVLVRLSRLAEKEMIIQTFAPSHPVFTALVSGDATRFYRAELAAREQFGYPPSRPLINLILTADRDEAVREAAMRFAGALAPFGEVLGPSPAPIARRRGRYRWQILVKGLPESDGRRALATLLAQWKLPRAVKLTIDVDPVDLL
jgi:primosomal protein N' (replication factor Y) (superfamily II helicase)